RPPAGAGSSTLSVLVRPGVVRVVGVGRFGGPATRAPGALVVVDPRPPAMLPLGPAALVPVSMPAVTLADGTVTNPAQANVVTLTVDGAGDYVAAFDSPHAQGTVRTIARIDADSLAAVAAVPALTGPAAVQPVTMQSVPQTASAVGQGGEVYFGTLLSARLVRVRTAGTASADALITFGFPGILDMVHTAAEPLTVAPCPTDFNRDGLVSPDDLDEFITCFFEIPRCPGLDFDGNGIISPDDLDDFMTAYFAGCP
ncbi:MAG: EF-hand domain-containing protein, partial [Phycisphaerales bacterium]